MTKTMSQVAALLALATLAFAGCGNSRFDAVRFQNKPTVTVVNDRQHTPEEPSDNPFVRFFYHTDSYFVIPLRHTTSMPASRRASNTNSMDEVPDSTWFTNRVGVREVTLEEMKNGANQPGGPMANKPWTIKSSKVGGKSVGFIIKDAAGDKYLLKFDQADLPEAETAADVIAAKILWAIGFNVAEDYIVDFTLDDLKIAPDAVIKPEFGDSKPLTEEVLREKLTLVYTKPDGSVRGLASRFLPGKPLDGWPRQGTRKGDPNDTVPHERRRELRGAYAFFSWLSHTDIKEDNTLDVYVKDPANPDVNYVVHYFIDIGKTFGVQEAAQKMRYMAHEYYFEPQSAIKQIATLGLRRRSWENRRSADLVGVGLWESATYDPGAWKTASPNYVPLLRKDKWDAFWGAKILIRFTEDQLRAAVSSGQLSDPRASEYILRVLLERQKMTARYWFNRVNPVDEFEISGSTLCFSDLMIKHALGGATPTYAARTFDYDGNKMSDFAPTAKDGGRVCVNGINPSSSKDGYVIVELTTKRAGTDTGATLVHLAKDPASGELRLIGLRRL